MKGILITAVVALVMCFAYDLVKNKVLKLA